MNLISSKKYRTEIDGFRAFSVLAVIIFHFGFIKNGYLGVDVFFVISGFLITGNIYNKVLQNQFSLTEFYIRRTKRIIPLVSFVCLVSLVLGVFFMLPDDLENLAQSIIATNFFNNNLLLLLTTGDYWDLVNEYKPLMHTWSLGIEEQFYLFFPFIILLINRFNSKYILPVIIFLTSSSIILFFFTSNIEYKFYLLPFRFFELSMGGIFAIIFNGKELKNNYSYFIFIILFSLIFFDFNFLSNELLILLVVILTSFALILNYPKNSIMSIIIDNKILRFVGKISFSVYMWHQLILAFSRYFIFKEINYIGYFFIFILTIIMSIISYYVIELPFRHKYKTKNVLLIILLIFLTTTISSYYIYIRSGVIRDVPELDYYYQSKVSKSENIKYNSSIYNLDKVFSSDPKLKILVIGDSFARDWCNILLESNFSNKIEISYMTSTSEYNKFKKRFESSDLVFFSRFSFKDFEKLNIPLEKIWNIGTKRFGINNGYFYNYNGDDYCNQRTEISDQYLDENNIYKNEWGDKFIDLIDLIIDEDKTVPVYTNECKFISQDCLHLTRFGAKYFSKLFENDKNFIVNRFLQ